MRCLERGSKNSATRASAADMRRIALLLLRALAQRTCQYAFARVLVAPSNACISTPSAGLMNCLGLPGGWPVAGSGLMGRYEEGDGATENQILKLESMTGNHVA